jgi:hypothetical protein
MSKARIRIEGEIEVPAFSRDGKPISLDAMTLQDFAALIAGHFENPDHLLSEIRPGRLELVAEVANPARGQLSLDLGVLSEPDLIERRFPLWDQ